MVIRSPRIRSGPNERTGFIDAPLTGAAQRPGIKADIEAALKRRWDSKQQDITVAVHDGDVTLSGRVQSLWDLERVLELAWNSPGVKHVKDDLSISW